MHTIAKSRLRTIALAAAAFTLTIAGAGAAAVGARQATRGTIVFVVASSATASPELAVRAPGGRVTLLTRNRWHEGLPSWSPDRRRIAFISARRGDADIHVIDADGRGERPLAGGSRRGSDELYPAWSPDGRLIAFSSYREGSGHVYVMSVDGTGVRRLTDTPPGTDNTQPRFSPDGRFVIFASTRSGAGHGLFRVRVSDGGGATRLTSRRDHALMPAYSPDGKRIAFVGSHRGWPAIWTMNADDGRLRVVARHAGRVVAYPRFSPDGSRLLYSVFRAGATVSDFRLRTVRLDGSRSREIGAGGEPDW